MTRINRIGYTKQADGSIDLVIPAGAAEEFKQAIKKAINCWPDTTAEFKDFADRLLERDSFVGSCMKTEIYGHIPHGASLPTEDKFEHPCSVIRQAGECAGHPDICGCATPDER